MVNMVFVQALGRVWVRRTKAFAALLGLSAVGVLAAALASKQTEHYQLNILADIMQDLPRLQQALQIINDTTEAEQKQLQAQTAETKRRLETEQKAQQEAKLKAEEESKRKLEANIPVMVALKGGCFQMGSPANKANRDKDEQQHRVCVQPFKLGKYEVTQAQWQAVMGSNPANFKDCGGDCPVEQVSFYQVHDFIAKLNQKTGQHYRLPTEAEWEYACRGGKQQTYCGPDNADAVAWYTNNSGRTTHPVGKKQGNCFGLYDLSGNVWEWTCSAYAETYNGNEKSCANDSTASRVLRGGSWDFNDWYARSANRYGGNPADRFSDDGFRLAQD